MKSKRLLFFNRELSWLSFNERVLEEAWNLDNPPLERLKFLAITGSNLDEFYMVRVGGLQMRKRTGHPEKDPAGLTPLRQLEAIIRRTRRIVAAQYRLHDELLNRILPAAGIHSLVVGRLSPEQKQRLTERMQEEIFPVLTPMAMTFDAALPPPLLRSLRVHLIVRLAPETDGEDERYAVLPFADKLRRFIPLPAPDGEYHFIPMEAAVRDFVALWFPGVEVRECTAFRLTRNADIEIQESEEPDLLAGMEDILAARKQSICSRLEIEEGASEQVRDFLVRRFCAQDTQIFFIDGLLGLKDMFSIAGVEGFDELKYLPCPPQPSPAVDPAVSIFDQIRSRDILLYHPYESYDPVIHFVQEAAEDPRVLAIKQVLYRTSADSPIITALEQAAEQGKHVTVLIELKARFDEERNINFGRRLEQAGVQVIYGVKRLKTHAKVCLVVRREEEGVVRYAHYGTGNYNETTARLYSDVSLFTCHPQLTADASLFFNAVCGYAEPLGFRRLVMSPFALRNSLLQLIDDEIQRAKDGQPAHIMAKMNALVDTALIRKLYQASAAGVKIRLNVRGICGLVPGLPKISRNIAVTSIVGRYLEHARIFSFHHGGENLTFISSADWMPRNLDRRVELLIPVDDASCRQRLLDILETHFRDDANAWMLRPDGTYQRKTSRRRSTFSSQQAFYQAACDAIEKARKARPTALEPHRPATPQPQR